MEPIIPEKMNEWNIRVLKRLLKIPDIEKESFDFKNNKVLDKDYHIEEHICAFTNTYGGYIILGVEEKEIKKNYKTFILNGFDTGTQDLMLRKIAQKIWMIEPLPLYDIRTIEENEKYYIILYIKSELYKRPFFVRDKCYIRIGSSTMSANRNIILAMINYSLVPYEDRRKHIEYVVMIYKRLTNLSLMKIKKQYYLIIFGHSMEINGHFKKNILIHGGLSDLDQILKLDNIYHLDLAISHLKYEDYRSKFYILEEIKEAINIINTNRYSRIEDSSDETINYPSPIVRYFGTHYKIGNRLYDLIIKFREEIYDLIRDLEAGDMLKGFCKMGY